LPDLWPSTNGSRPQSGRSIYKGRRRT